MEDEMVTPSKGFSLSVFLLLFLFFLIIQNQHALAQTGVIRGTVTEEGTGNPIPDLQVDLYDSSTLNYVGYALTDASGNYTKSGLATGLYKIGFNVVSALNYIPEYFNNSSDLNGATAVSVTSGSETSGINAQLAQGGVIKGIVTEEGTGNPIPGLPVDLYNSSTLNNVGYALTDASGNFTKSGLATGSYKISFNLGSGLNYVPEYYNNAPDSDSAAIVSVTAGSETLGIDAQLAQGGVVKGTVTEEGTGNPIPGLQVYVYESSTLNYVGYAQTDASGNYTKLGLATGSYKISFNLGSGLNYVPEYYNNAPDSGSAAIISVTAGSETLGIDAQLAQGGVVKGTVTEEGTGNPIPGLQVDVYESSTLNYVGFAITDAFGYYTKSGLATGLYKMGFNVVSGLNYIPEYYNNATNLVGATPVSVTAGSETLGINAQLALARHLIFLPLIKKDH
jgi:protocatechuate 3,4-dioxygenase beta subunit